MGDLQPLASPDTLNPFGVDYPDRLAQQSGDLAIAIATVLPSNGETLLVFTTARDLAASGQAAAAPPRRVMNSRRFMRPPAELA
jgi:hypothetical protein